MSLKPVTRFGGLAHQCFKALGWPNCLFPQPRAWAPQPQGKRTAASHGGCSLVAGRPRRAQDAGSQGPRPTRVLFTSAGRCCLRCFLAMRTGKADEEGACGPRQFGQLEFCAVLPRVPHRDKGHKGKGVFPLASGNLGLDPVGFAALNPSVNCCPPLFK